MIQSDNVDILTGIIFSNIALAVVPAAVKQGKFYLSPNAGPSQLAGKGCDPNYFNVAYQNDNQHEAAGEYSNTLGYKKTFILAPNYPAGKDCLNGFKRFYKGEVAGELYTKLGQTDFAAEIAQIKASGADSVFFFLPGGMGISFIKQFVNSDTGLPMIGPGFSFDQDILGAVGEAALGAHNTAQWSPDLDNPANKAFVAAFEAEYGRLPSVYASQGYDTALSSSSRPWPRPTSPTTTPSTPRSRPPTSPPSAAASSSATTSTRSRTSTPARSSSATTASSPTASSAPPSRTTSTPTPPSARCSDPAAGPPAAPPPGLPEATGSRGGRNRERRDTHEAQSEQYRSDGRSLAARKQPLTRLRSSPDSLPPYRAVPGGSRGAGEGPPRADPRAARVQGRKGAGGRPWGRARACGRTALKAPTPRPGLEEREQSGAKSPRPETGSPFLPPHPPARRAAAVTRAGGWGVTAAARPGGEARP